MNKILFSLSAVALVAAASRTAAASCTIAGAASVKQYWPASGTTSSAGDTRCDNADGTACHLSGWLYKPTSSGAHPAIVYQAGAHHEESRWDACEFVNHFVARGYVVFVPYARGTDDISGHDTSKPGEGFHNTGANWTDVGGSAATVAYLSDEANDLITAAQWLQRQSFVDSSRLAVVGAGVGGMRASIAGSRFFFGTPQPAAVVDLSGAVWSWDDSSWRNQLELAAMLHLSPILFQQVDNENDADYTPTQTQLFDADNGFDAKMAVYGPENISDTAQNICDERGYGDDLCISYTFVTDGPEVARWISTVDSFLTQHGVK